MAQPNILFLMTDHTNAQATAPGSPVRKPHLDALAAAGVRFGRCYTTNAICSPARASLMTGLYPSTHGIWDCTHTQPRGWVDLMPGNAHFAQHLAAAGYRNGYFGKWHVDPSGKLDDFGWHEYDLKCSNAPHRPLPGTVLRVATAGYRDYELAGVSADEGCLRHPAVDRGIEFIRQRAGKPFCCFVSTSEPHDPYYPPQKFYEQYERATLPLSPTLRDEPTGKPEIVRRLRQVWQGLTEDDWRHVTAAYRAEISFLDSEVGRILDALRATGQYDNTIIVFTSDHGDMQGGHGLLTKGVGTPYEEVYNIPLILRAPGGPHGREDAQTVTSLVDVSPTLLDLCGVASLPRAQGRSLRPVLEGRANAADWREAYAEFYGQRFVYTQRITWHDRWKYVFSPGGVDELYDLQADPHERVNLAGNPAHAATLIEMTQRMWRKMKAIDDRSLLQSHYATLRLAPVGPESIE